MFVVRLRMSTRCGTSISVASFFFLKRYVLYKFTFFFTYLLYFIVIGLLEQTSKEMYRIYWSTLTVFFLPVDISFRKKTEAWNTSGVFSVVCSGKTRRQMTSSFCLTTNDNIDFLNTFCNCKFVGGI